MPVIPSTDSLKMWVTTSVRKCKKCSGRYQPAEIKVFFFLMDILRQCFIFGGDVCFKVSGMRLCFGSRRKNNVGNTSVFIVAAKWCCTEPKLFAAKDKRIREGTELGQLT